MAAKREESSSSSSIYRNSKWHNHHHHGIIYNASPINQINIESLLGQTATTSQLTRQLRSYCSKRPRLSHVDVEGKAVMVDVADKDITTREAVAGATVEVGPTISKLIHENNMSKGDVLSVAQIAGILGAKKTSELIPLCHNIALSSVNVKATLNREQHRVELTARVRCCGQTGVEMEALTAVSIAALTVYDMCKALSHDITIRDVQLFSKSGGKRAFNRTENEIK